MPTMGESRNEYTASLTMDRAYFEESYEQWLRCRSRYRKWQISISLLAVVAAGVAWSVGPDWLVIGLIAVAVIEFVDAFRYRRYWTARRIRSRIGNRHDRVEIRVSDSGVYQKGPTSEGKMTWDAVKAVVPTDKGVFLAVGDGMSMYIPDSSMNDPGFKEFVGRMAARSDQG